MKGDLRRLLEDEFGACAEGLAEAHRRIEAFWDDPAVIELAVRAYYSPERRAELPCHGSPLEEYLYGALFNSVKPELERQRHGFANAPVLRPAISLYPDLWHSHFIAAVMGVEIAGPEGVGRNEQSPTTSWCQPFLSSPDEGDKIVGLDVMSHPSFLAYLEDLATTREITHGVIPLEIIYGVGPVDVAADLLGYEGFLEGLYTHPQQMHEILELCTTYWLQIVRAQMAAAGWARNKFALPGMIASEMIAPQVSLEQVQEFFVPVRRRLAQSFGKVFATMNHPDIRSLDLWMEMGGCVVCGFVGQDQSPTRHSFGDGAWSANDVVPRMREKAGAMFAFNHDPGHLPCPSWEEHLARFRTFAGQVKVDAILTGIRPPGAEECAVQHLRDLQSAWTSGNYSNGNKSPSRHCESRLDRDEAIPFKAEIASSLRSSQ